MIALRVNGEEIDLADLLDGAKFQGRTRFIDEAIASALVRQAAAAMGIEVSDEELQQAADDFRTASRLYQAEATRAWLAARRLQQEDWEAALEDEILRAKVRRKISADKIDQYFAENRRALDAATVMQIVVEDENVARELRAQCVEDQVSFYEVAGKFPDARTIGRRRREEMEPMLSAAIFGAAAGEVAGPVRTGEGWCLALVEARHPATLDARTREEIAEAIFAEWLESERKKATIEAPILDLR